MSRSSIVCIARSRAMKSTRVLKSLERLPKGPVTKATYSPYKLSSCTKVDPGCRESSSSAALFDVNVDLPGAGHDRNQKTGERFVLDKKFAANERVRGRERPSIAVSRIDDYVRNDALEEARIDLVDWVSGIVTLIR